MKTIIVAAGLCTPARVHVRKALDPYGVQYRIVANYWLAADGGRTRRVDEFVADLCEVRVSDRAARWAEYLILRSGHTQLLSKPIDPRNEAWAMRWRGQMPGSWVQPGCTTKPYRQSRRPWWQRLFR